MIITDTLFELYEKITPFQAALATSLLLFYFIYLFLRDNDLPPGPIGLPLLGYWPFLKDETAHIQLKNMAEKYGDIFSLRVAGTLYIHLGSIKAVKEAHITKSEYFGGRLTDYSIFFSLFKDGLAVINGEPWKVLRKFFLMKFKEYGMNATNENAIGSIHDTMIETVQQLHDTKGQPIAIADFVSDKCMHIIRRILFNDQGINVKEVKDIIKEHQELVTGLKPTIVLLCGNIAKYFIFPFMPSNWLIKRNNKRIEDILFNVVNRHKRMYDETQAMDIIDCYIKERVDRREKGDLSAKYFTDKALVSTLNQFISDGILFVGLLIENIFSNLIQHPEEQEKVYEEIIEVIGPEKMPTMEDKPNLPYINAFLYEVIRTTDLFPLFPGLQCTKETIIQGHKIPKGSITLINFYAAHRDPNIYDNPEEFNPSRYLPSSDGQRSELPILFGVGKRSCIGEGFCMTQAFMFLTTVVKNFRLIASNGVENKSSMYFMEEKLRVCAIPRLQKEH